MALRIWAAEWVGLGRTHVGERERDPADFESEEESCERERRDGRGRPRCRQQREGVRQKMLTGTPSIEMLMMLMYIFCTNIVTFGTLTIPFHWLFSQDS